MPRVPNSHLHCFTTTPLAANGVYTSTWQRTKLHPISAGIDSVRTKPPVVADYRAIRGLVASDKASVALTGFTVLMANAEDQSDSMVVLQQGITGGTPYPFEVPLYGKYVAIQYTTVLAQTTFSLGAWLVK